MSWGTSYTYEGYLSRIGKRELEDKKEEYQRINDMLWREILAYMASTPPAMMKSDEGHEYPWPEFISMRFQHLREEIENNAMLIARIDDCLEAMHDNPESVVEG